MRNRFLIVDDDAIVRRATARLVEHCTGSPVDACGSAEEALRVFEGEPGDYAGVVTDFDMPGMNGLELGERLRAIAPGVRMLLVTGNPGALNVTDVKQRGFDAIIAKPFALAAIRDALLGIMPVASDVPAVHSRPTGSGAAFPAFPGALHAFI